MLFFCAIGVLGRELGDLVMKKTPLAKVSLSRG